MRILPQRRASWPLLVLLLLAMATGVVTVVLKHFPHLFSARRVTVTAPETVTPGQRFFIEVELRNRKDNAPWPDGRAALIALTPEPPAEVGSGRKPEWISIGADGRARLPATFNSAAAHGRGLYLVKIEDDAGSDAELIGGVFEFAQKAVPASPGNDVAVRAVDNMEHVGQRDLERYTRWRNAAVTAFLSLFLAWAVVLVIEESEQSKYRKSIWHLSCLEITIVVCVMAVIIALALPSLTRQRRQPGPDAGVSREARDAVIDRLKASKSAGKTASGELIDERFTEERKDGE